MLGYEMVGLILFSFLAILPLSLLLIYVMPVLKSRVRFRQSWKRVGFATLLTAVLYGGVAVTGFLIEPNFPRISRMAINGPFTDSLRILHISDLHLEKTKGRRERWLVEKVKALKPDLIVITGDTHQIGNTNVDSLNAVLKHINAPLGVFHCTGYDDLKMLGRAAPHVVFLENAGIEVLHEGKTIGIVGLIAVGDRTPFYDAIRDCDYRIVLNHTPDLAEEAAAQNVNLYLCGHTHGGQVRIPGWGAIITNARTGKRFESGMYRLQDTWIYTSRGFGLEPLPAPQVRFFCRPEITLFTIGEDD